MQHKQYPNGYVILGDCLDPEIVDFINNLNIKIGLILTDPPYGNIVKNKWDKINEQNLVSLILNTLKTYTKYCDEGTAAYVWGGTGTPNNRPFYNLVIETEKQTDWKMSNHITWAKKKGYGTQYNYLYTREELAYFVLGKINKPRVFNVPYLSEKRGYAGWNKKYPAKSEFYRRTNVWKDISDLVKSKLHPTEKPIQLLEIVINTSSNPEEFVVDFFGGSGSTAVACINLNRKFIIIEKDPSYYDKIIQRLDCLSKSDSQIETIL